ncbi:MAG: pyridoxamine 5'-phosphate oxidase [Verrucomicrobia bacterium]|nr:pyridoxamine 5'-phosphate oxidase [Verrucomicrobiota bacterium]
MSVFLESMRSEYSKAGLRRSELHDDPMEQFQIWMKAAVDQKIHEPNAMTLATVDSHGMPNARIVLLKGADARGFSFYTNQQSTKGLELANHPFAALVFLWKEMERQVRIRGSVSKLPRSDVQAYFSTRPRGSRLGAWVSRQSSVIADRTTMETRLAELEREYPADVPVPEEWGGYSLAPTELEFWQGRPNRLHDRFRYRLASNAWVIERLSP